MAKTLDRVRPPSTIADMIDDTLIHQATNPPEVVIGKDSAESATGAQGAELQASATATSPPATPVLDQAPLPGPLSGAGAGERTGEHSDIQKMYRLTPTAHRTIQQLSMRLGTSLGFDMNNSVVVRSVLRVVHDALAEIDASIEQGLTPRKQPSTAIGNEHARDALEQEIADAIREGIRLHAANTTTR